MKKLLFTACLAMITAGCKKESQTTHVNSRAGNKALFAKWELRRTSGGLQPDVLYLPGNGNGIQFNADSTYAFYTGGTVSKQGTFHIAENSFAMTPEKFEFIYYDHSNSGDIITLKSDTLIIGTSAADGIESLYIKK